MINYSVYVRVKYLNEEDKIAHFSANGACFSCLNPFKGDPRIKKTLSISYNLEKSYGGFWKYWENEDDANEFIYDCYNHFLHNDVFLNTPEDAIKNKRVVIRGDVDSRVGVNALSLFRSPLELTSVPFLYKKYKEIFKGNSFKAYLFSQYIFPSFDFNKGREVIMFSPPRSHVTFSVTDLHPSHYKNLISFDPKKYIGKNFDFMKKFTYMSREQLFGAHSHCMFSYKRECEKLELEQFIEIWEKEAAC